MPFELLRRLCASKMPVTVEKGAEIDEIAVLTAAGMIDAVLPSFTVTTGRYGYAGPAEVLKVTALGIAVVGRHVG